MEQNLGLGRVSASHRWTQRNKVDLCGHRGFVRLALKTGVPVVPVVTHSSHDAFVIVTRGERMTKMLGLGRLRIKVFLIFLTPLGLSTILTPPLPMPSAITMEFLPAFAWSAHGLAAADDDTGGDGLPQSDHRGHAGCSRSHACGGIASGNAGLVTPHPTTASTVGNTRGLSQHASSQPASTQLTLRISAPPWDPMAAPSTPARMEPWGKCGSIRSKNSSMPGVSLCMAATCAIVPTSIICS